MRIIKTENYIKIAGNTCDYNDRPNFSDPKSENGEGHILLEDNLSPDSEEDVVKRWKNKKKRQLVQEEQSEEMPKPPL